MTKEALIEMEGVVTHELPDTRFRVTLDGQAPEHLAQAIAHAANERAERQPAD